MRANTTIFPLVIGFWTASACGPSAPTVREPEQRKAASIVVPPPSEPPAPVTTVPPTPAPASSPSSIVAKVDGVEITLRQVTRGLTPAERTDIDTTTDPAGRVWLTRRAQRRALDEVIDEYVLFHEAQRKNIVVAPAEIDAVIEQVKKANGLDQKGLEAAVRRVGNTISWLRDHFTRQIAVLRLVARQFPPVTRKQLAARLRRTATIEIRLTVPPRPASLRALLDAARLLTVDDLRRQLKTTGQFTTARVSGRQRTRTYDSWHFRSVRGGEANDLAYHIWIGAPAELRKRYRELRQGLAHTKTTNLVGDAAFRAQEKGLLGYATVDYKKGLVVLVTCGTRLCPNHTALLAIAKLLVQRANRLH